MSHCSCIPEFKKLSKDMDIKITQIKILELKTSMPDMKNTLGGINVRLVRLEEEVSTFEDISVETIQKRYK